MPLNKLENFIKNTEGRILYVNPNDLDATDSISNEGNSLAQPFKTIQRALLESARFSYLRGNNNDLIEKTTILCFPGEHLVDNRPGFGIRNVGGVPTAVSPSGTTSNAADTLTLNLESNFDLTQEDNLLYKFNSINGGVIIPRGTSIVGLDLRKTKVRPKYVPNPTDSSAGNSALFRITGTCYFHQFTFFDGDDTGLVYTDPIDFSANNQSKPTFSHHKLTCFEYADGVNIPTGFDITDLDMYYSKLSNAYNSASTREIDATDKFPANSLGFAKQRPEYEIVGAFASDPINITSIISGDGSTPGTIITVTTATDHGLTTGTPIKINGVDVLDYNISTKVQNVTSATTFTYLLPFVRDNLPASPGSSVATVVIETDTVSGASPYIFNISLRSVYGMNGMHADGAKASGFRSIVVAQFTAISLQKDDRAFVKYNETSRLYEGIAPVLTKGSALSTQSSSLDPATVYHLDSGAVYRTGYETTHVKISNDAVVQIVSCFAIGFTKHFETLSGGDVSITNSNSNFGQIAQSSDGFKKAAFDKDDRAYITSIITPKSITASEISVDWQRLDVGLTTSVGISSHLYLFGFNTKDNVPPTVIQGYRVGAKVNEKLFVNFSNTTGYGTSEATIQMVDNSIATSGFTTAMGTTTSKKRYVVTSGPASNIFTIGTHELLTGEKVRIFSDDGDLPENLTENTVYFAIKQTATSIKLASSKTNADMGTAITVHGGTKLSIESRVSDKSAGEIGSPLQFDPSAGPNGNWYIHANSSNDIYTTLDVLGEGGLGDNTQVSFVKRIPDERSIDEKIYKIRVVVPKELDNSKNPEEGFILQESSTTAVRSNADFTLSSISESDYAFKRNPRFISTCSHNSGTVTVVADIPHDLKVGEQILVKNVTDASGTTTGAFDKGYNGTFLVTGIVDDKTFQYSTTDTAGATHTVGNFTNNIHSRTTLLPRFERNDLKSNFYIYRNETIASYVKDVQDGIYHLFVLHADNAVPTEFTSLKYGQNVVDLYPQLDRDNNHSNPPASESFAKRQPLGDVATNDLQKSITRESSDKLLQDFGRAKRISGITTDTTAGITTITFDRPHGFGSIVGFSQLTGGSGYTNGTYHNVKMFNNGTTTWDGATAKVTVAGNAITAAEVTEGGSGYTNAEELDFDPSQIGGGTGAGVTITSSGISTNVGDVVQITGVGTVTDGLYRIASVPSGTQISIAVTTGDPDIVTNQYALHVAPSVSVSSVVFDATAGISTITCSGAHGLVPGNAFRILDNSNNNIGDFNVKERVGINTFTATTTTQLSNPTHVLKIGMSAATVGSDKENENLGARGLSFYGGETLTIGADLTNGTTVQVDVPGVGIGTTTRFPLGSYIQVGNEIMRVKSATLSGSGNNELSVIRGSLGSVQEDHVQGSVIRKIDPIPVEFRRPSIIRSSGHTFEYVGYGPGNYSTSLPQVQVRTLTEREEFLNQSQERSCGTVVYTGMNNRGDFFIGNKRVSSATGQERTFDAPVPTVTGEDPSRLSVIFDEVIVKERLVVEGGKSRTILSQFDGPVTFNEVVKMNAALTVNELIKLNGTFEITNQTQSNSRDTGSFTTDGGLGVERNLNVGENFFVTGISTFNGAVTFNTSLLPDSDEGASVGSAALPWSEAHFGEIRIAVTDDNTIDTATGNLTLDSTGGTVSINDDLSVTGTVDVTSNIVGGGNLTVTGAGTSVTAVKYYGDGSALTGIDQTALVDGNGTTRVQAHTDGADITGSLSLTSTLDVAGISTFTGAITASGGVVGNASSATILQTARTIGGVSFNGSANINLPGVNQTGNQDTTGNAATVTTTANSSNSNQRVAFHAATSGDATLRNDAGLQFNPSSNKLTVSGEGSFGGDVIAFASDDRLKENKVNITGALDKVSSLSGFTYNFNETAGELGLPVNLRLAGVSAQEVQKVLPEVVKPAPVSDKYITVQYEKLVPLLIEAIKELRAEVEELKRDK